MKQLTIREAADFLLRNDNYVLLTHRRPDGDTIGSAAALCAGLRSLGKTAHVLENPQFTEKFRPWLGKLTCETLPSSACVVSVDIAAENLLPFDLPDCAVELQIDHHAGNRQFGLQAFVDASAAACGEIILRLLQLMEVKLDASMGAALYVAISTDTGCFRFNNTTANTLRCAAACKDTGADTFAINTALFMTKRLPRLQLEARLTEKMEFYAGGAVAVNTLPNALLVELGLTEDDVDDISGFSREIAGVEIGVMLREGPDGGKISLRCSPKYDAAAICARLGGGGHRGAAGASVPEGLDAAKKAIDTIVFVPEVGSLYYGRVVRLMTFGAFVELAPGKDGLVHISKLADKRIEKVEDACKVGDMMWVKVTEIDEKGRVNLSHKDAMKEIRAKEAAGEIIK